MNLEKIFEKIYFECNLEVLFEQVIREADNNYYSKWAIFKSDEKTKQYYFIKNTSGSLAEVYYMWSINQKFADASYIIAPVGDDNKYLINDEEQAAEAASQVTEYALTLSKKFNMVVIYHQKLI